MPAFLALKLHLFLAGMLIAADHGGSRARLGLHLAVAVLLALVPLGGKADTVHLLVRALIVVGFFALIHLRTLRAVDGISQKQLTQTLRSLQRHGFALRVAFATIPPRVEYELTELGQDFVTSVRQLGAFAVRNQQSIEAARRDFDTPAA
jgi:hypothetical protein